MSDTSGLLSLYNLLARASNVSCSKGANAFLSLLTTEDDRISLAIDGFIPAIQNPDLQIPQRILAAYVLNALYVSHDHLNPIHDHFLRIFESERALAIAASRINSSFVGSSQRALESLQARNGTQAASEQLVWVLWKILQGESDDLAPFSPVILSRTTIPEHLQPLNLVVHDMQRRSNGTHVNPVRSTTESPQPPSGIMGPTTSQYSRTLFQTGHPTPTSQTSHKPSEHNSAPTRASSASQFSPLDSAYPGSISRKVSDGNENQLAGWPQQTSSAGFASQSRHQPSQDVSRMASGGINSPAFPNYVDQDRKPTMTSDQRQQTLLRALYEEPYVQSDPGSSFGGVVGIKYHPNMNHPGNNTRMTHETSRIDQQRPLSRPSLSRASTQHSVQQLPAQNILSNYSERKSSPTSLAFNPRFNARPQLEPVSHPQPRSLSSGSSSLHSPTSTPLFENSPDNGRLSRPEMSAYGYELPNEPQMRMDEIIQQKPGIPFAHLIKLPASIRIPPPTRPPGVIGSGRPSASLSKTDASMDQDTVGSRRSPIGVIGNGRPDSSAALRNASPFSHDTSVMKGHESMVPFSVIRTRSVKEESVMGEPGVIGRSKPDVGNVPAQNGDGQIGLLERMAALSVERQPKGTPREFSSTTLLEPGPRAPNRNWPSNQDTVEFAPTPSQILIDPTPLQGITTAPQSQSFSAAYDDTKNGSTPVSPHYPSSASPSASASEYRKVNGFFEIQPSLAYSTSKAKQIPDTQINEKERDELSHAIVLLLSSRERVLTLTEQRMLLPHLPILTQPLSLLRPDDIPPVVAKNTDLAAKLLVLLLDRNDEDAERTERILKEASKNGFHPNPESLDGVLPSLAPASLDPEATMDALQGVVDLVTRCGTSSEFGAQDVSPFGGREAKESYLNALRNLPPTMQSFNLVARLLRPTHQGETTSAQQDDSSEARVASLIRVEVLGGFISGCVRWIEHAEQEEKEGEVHDDRVAVAISSLCRFYFSLLKHGFVSAVSEADTTEIMSFALQFSRFEEARSLYSTLAAART